MNKKQVGLNVCKLLVLGGLSACGFAAIAEESPATTVPTVAPVAAPEVKPMEKNKEKMHEMKKEEKEKHHEMMEKKHEMMNKHKEKCQKMMKKHAGKGPHGKPVNKAAPQTTSPVAPEVNK